MNSYNSRLFEGKNLRSFFHNSRFHWLRNKLSLINDNQLHVFELGCFDGRSINYFPFRPEKYTGFDADWEGGVSDAQKNIDIPNYEFVKSSNPEDLLIYDENNFDISISMETIEHIDPNSVENYINQIHRITKNYFYITVPNEKGVVFLVKHLAKKVIYGGTQDYTNSEVFYAAIGKLGKVKRDDHKGFDYEKMIEMVSKKFDIISIEPVPFHFLPTPLGFTIGIVAKKCYF